MSKYKVGDTVRIREDLKADEYIDEVFVEDDMIQYSGMEATIEKITDTEPDCYELDVDGLEWFWTNGMFEDVPKILVEKESRTIDIPIDLLNKWNDVEMVYGSNMNAYITTLIEADMRKNYDRYVALAKMMKYPFGDEVPNDRKLYKAIIDTLSEKYSVESEEEAEWILSMPISKLLRELKEGDVLASDLYNG